MRLHISPTMDIDALIERMYVNGDAPKSAEAEARVMRDLLVRDAPAYEWTHTGDVEDIDWFRMLREAAAGPVTLSSAARQFEDCDDCLSAACEKVAHQLGVELYQVEARWEDDNQRNEILVTVTGSGPTCGRRRQEQ